MIGPGAGGCGMAALFKVLDPLGKARGRDKKHVEATEMFNRRVVKWVSDLEKTLKNMRRWDVTLANAGLRS